MLWQVPDALRLLPPEAFGASIDELLVKFPEAEIKRLGTDKTKWTVKPGVNGTGRWAIAVLRFDKPTGETLAFGAIEGDGAPEHEHVDGETIYTLAGIGDDVTDDEERVELRPGSIIVHRAKSIHTPSSRSFWVFVYYQPKGLRFTSPLTQ